MIPGHRSGAPHASRSWAPAKSGRLDLNQRPLDPQSNALNQAALRPEQGNSPGYGLLAPILGQDVIPPRTTFWHFAPGFPQTPFPVFLPSGGLFCNGLFREPPRGRLCALLRSPLAGKEKPGEFLLPILILLKLSLVRQQREKRFLGGLSPLGETSTICSG